MKTLFSSVLVIFVALAAQNIFSEVVVTEMVVKKPVPGQSVGAGYFLAANTGNEPRILVSVSSAATERVEMHTHVHEHHGDQHQMTMKMVEVAEVEIPANSEFRFEPGKHHLMLFSPQDAALSSGSIDLVFTFKNGETVNATAAVEGW